MVKPLLPTLARLAPALALCSCAAPKAIVVSPAPAAPQASSTPPAALDPPLPALPDDGIRLPDMLAMPAEGEFHATSPTAPKTGPDANAVISRPPTDPPPRPKPKSPEP